MSEYRDELALTGGGAMQPQTHDPLDRLWAATRPDEPSAEAFDALWSQVTARASEPEVLTMPGVGSWKRWVFGAVALAQAAALLVAAGMALKIPKPVEVAKLNPSASPVIVHEYRVDGGKTLFVSLGDGKGEVTGVELRAQMQESDTDMVAVEDNILTFMESAEKESSE